MIGYHGTTVQRANAIRRDGLRPSVWHRRPASVYFADNELLGRQWGYGAAAGAGRYAVVILDIPPEAEAHIVIDEQHQAAWLGINYRIPGPVPAAWVRDVRVFDTRTRPWMEAR